jgi:hypothetical protein
MANKAGVSTLSKVLFVMLIGMGAMFAITINQVYKERDQLINQKRYELQSKDVQFKRELRRTEQQRDSLDRRLRDLNLRDSLYVRTIDSLTLRLVNIPKVKRYVNKTDKELGELMDKRAHDKL